MNTHRRSLLLGFATLALAGCASKPALSYLADADVDFRAYRTFAFSPINANPSLIDRRLLAAARSQLESRGYVFDEFAPDLLVNIVAVLEEREGSRTMPGSFPAWGGAESRDHHLGRMAVDLIDPRRQQVVWHGRAEGRVSPAMLRDTGSAVEKAVAAVFEDFPIRASAPVAAKAPIVR